MGKRIRFVQPEVDTLTLSDGDFLVVKRRLSIGEERAAFQQIVGKISIDNGWRQPNVELLGMAEIAAYLVDWSFTDAQGKRVPVSLAAIKQLDPDTYAEVEQAVNAHIAAQQAVREAEKNGQGGESASSVISTSAG